MATTILGVGRSQLMINAAIHRLILSHLKASVEVVARQRTDLQGHQLTAASQPNLDTDEATLLPSAAPDVVVVSTVALLREGRPPSYSSPATHEANFPHDQSTTTHNTLGDTAGQHIAH